MDDATITALAGLGGALIGALAAIGAQALNHRHQGKAERRREQWELLARFWAAADRLSAAVISLDYTIGDIQASRQAGHHDRMPDLDSRRLAEIAERDAARGDVRVLLAQMRMLHPSLATPAQELFDASGVFDHQHRETMLQFREARLDAFETAAIEAMGV